MLEVTRDECEEILKKVVGESPFEIESFVVKRVTGFYGFLGEYFRMEIQIQEGKKFKFFLKSLPITNEKQKKVLKELGIFEKEVKLYRNLIPALQSFFPQGE